MQPILVVIGIMAIRILLDSKVNFLESEKELEPDGCYLHQVAEKMRRNDLTPFIIY